MSLLLLLAGCAGPQVSKKSGEVMELGWVGRSVIQSPQYRWFDSTYAAYTPVADMLEDLHTRIDSVEFLVIFGTWCSDSRRELPPFFKILDHLNVPAHHVRLFGVDRSKQYPEGPPQQYNVELVPTIVVKRGGQEIGRIVEKPKTTLELDLLEIFLTSGR